MSNSGYRIANDEIIADLQRCAEKTGDRLKMKFYQREGKYSVPTITNRFDSWNNAKEKADLERIEGPSNTELIKDLKKCAEECQGTLTAAEYRERGQFYPNIFSFRFGSWNEAKEEAGLKAVKGYKIPKKEVIEDLRRVNEFTEQPLKVNFYSEHGEHSVFTLLCKFGSWNDAKREAGLQLAKSGPSSDIQRKEPENKTIVLNLFDQFREYGDRLRSKTHAIRA